eukprot:TRINITY_DN1332_c0_g1_i4.p1 TRINITY_DN1332_c0_g1~~TRINITY_DN1332_c0_g1_i4.p1  ORF type:complete len:368 (-),score=47.35 TRINITY_DN1332_c0_g1_i4:150-1253(-)
MPWQKCSFRTLRKPYHCQHHFNLHSINWEIQLKRFVMQLENSFHSICKIHFNQVYYPIEINTQTYNTYQQSQVLISSSLARDHAGITLDFFEECLTRLRMVDTLARDRLLRYLNPWMRNITLTPSSTGILDKLVVVTLKFGSLFVNTVRNLWLTLASHATNLKVILSYLIHKSVEEKNLAFIYTAQKIAVILFGGNAQDTTNFLVEQIQIGDYTVDSIEDNIAYKAKTPISPQEAFNQVYNNPVTAEQWELEQMLPFCSQEVTFSASNVAVMLLCDLFLQKQTDEFLPHLPLLLHIGILGFDDPSLLVADFSKTLIANLTYCLAAKTPAKAEAYILVEELSDPAITHSRFWKHENATPDHYNLSSTG